MKSSTTRSPRVWPICLSLAALILSSRAFGASKYGLVAFTEVEAKWQQAQGSGSLNTSGWKFLEGAPIAVEPPPSDDDDDVVAGPKPKPAPVPGRENQTNKVFKTFKLASQERAGLVQRMAYLELFLRAADGYSLAKDPEVENTAASELSGRSAAVLGWRTRAQIELALIKLALGFDAPAWSDKCGNFNQASGYATILKIDGTSVPAEARTLFTSLGNFDRQFALRSDTQAASGFSLAKLCQLPPPSSKTQQESDARKVVNRYIQSELLTIVHDTRTLLKGPAEAYQSVSNAAIADVPTNDILELRRRIENTLSKLKLVSDDMLQLYSSPNTGASPVEALTEQLKKADLKQLFQKTQAAANLTQSLAVPLAEYQEKLGKFFTDVERLGQISPQVKKECDGLRVIFDKWNIATQAQPEALNTRLSSCLDEASQAYANKTSQGMSEEEAQKRDLLNEVSKLSCKLTNPNSCSL